MSKCQKNKYAAGGKCGSMSGLGSEHGKNPELLATFGEVNTNFAALLASREKQDLLFNNELKAPATQPKAPATQLKAPATPKHHSPATQQAIVPIQKKLSKSDIDIVLEGDF